MKSRGPQTEYLNYILIMIIKRITRFIPQIVKTNTQPLTNAIFGRHLENVRRTKTG